MPNMSTKSTNINPVYLFLNSTTATVVALTYGEIKCFSPHDFFFFSSSHLYFHLHFKK